VDLARHAVKGTWEERDDILVLTDAPSNPRVMVPAVPLGNYELEVTCRRTWGMWTGPQQGAPHAKPPSVNLFRSLLLDISDFTFAARVVERV